MEHPSRINFIFAPERTKRLKVRGSGPVMGQDNHEDSDGWDGQYQADGDGLDGIGEESEPKEGGVGVNATGFSVAALGVPALPPFHFPLLFPLLPFDLPLLAGDFLFLLPPGLLCDQVGG